MKDSNMEQTLQLLSDILEPGEEYTPIPFWFFNDAPDETKIRTQLADYVEKGVHGFVLHPRIGVPESLPYLSEEYFQMVRFIVKTADELGMKVVLYDEGMYPSGSAHGMVVATNPEYASKGITLRREVGEGAVITTFLGAETSYLVYDYTHGTIRGIHFGEDDGEPGAPRSADILNPEAVDTFIHLTHDRYYEALKEYFGNTVIGFFTDEPCALGRNAGRYREWVPGMEQELIEQGGSLEELEGLFTGQENASTHIYHKLIKKHLRETFYARLSRWCESHGIALMGHPEASDDVEEELYFHIPGQDLIMRRVSPETGGLREFDSVQAKLSADIARLLGRRRNANECFGVCCRDGIPWYFTAKDMKWYINWLGMRGVNLFVPHAFYYSVEGARSGERPPDVGANNIWWEHYRYFSDYMKRLSFLMTDAEDQALVAVLCDNNCVPYGEIACLYEHQIPFRYVPVGLLGEDTPATVDVDAFQVVVNLLDAQWDEVFPQAQVLHEGAEVLTFAEAQKSVSMRSVQTKEVCPGLRAVHLKKYGQDVYLLCNEGMGAIHTEVLIPGKALPIRVDLWEGTWRIAEEAGVTVAGDGDQTAKSTAGTGQDEGRFVELDLAPCETVLLLPDEAGIIRSLGAGSGFPEKGILQIASREQTTYQTRYLELNFRLTKRECNQAEYQATFTAEQPQGGETITVSGEEMAECCCNDTFVGVSFYAPHTFRIGSHLQKGDNTITLRFTGNAANIYNQAGLPVGM